MTQSLKATDTPRALDGVRVLDVTGPAGFYCTKLLADLGADVVRVEALDGGADRSPGPFFGDRADPDRSLYRWHYHTNKRSILLDIKKSADRKTFDSLLSVADVLVDTYRSSEAADLGLDGPTVRRHHPALVHTNITGFGADGPRADYKATDIVAQAMSGLMALTGYPEDPPNQLGGEQAYHMASLHAAVGTLLALLARDLDGAGRDVGIAMQDATSMAILQSANFNEYTWHGLARSRTGLNSFFGTPPPPSQGHRSPQSVYACNDGWIVCSQHTTPGYWRNFVAWLASFGAQEELGETRFEDPSVREEDRGRISEVLAAFAARHSAKELYHSAQRTGVLCSPVQNVADFMEDEQLRDRAWFVDVEHPELGRAFTYPGAPYKLSETPWQVNRKAPLIGGGAHDILTDWLDVSPETAAGLLDQRIPNG